MLRFALGVLILMPAVILAAPVPTHLMPRPEIRLRYDPARHPLAGSFEVAIRNAGSAELQVWTDRPFGIAAFLDAEIRNDKGERISRAFRWHTPADMGASLRLAEAIPSGRAYVTALPAFNSVDEKSLVAGKYKVRVRFKYQDHDVVSDWVLVEVTELQLRTKHIELGP